MVQVYIYICSSSDPRFLINRSLSKFGLKKLNLSSPPLIVDFSYVQHSFGSMKWNVFVFSFLLQVSFLDYKRLCIGLTANVVDEQLLVF